MGDDISKRIQRTTARAGRPAHEGAVAQSASFMKPEKTYPHRVTLDLTADQYEALRRGAYEGRSTIANILRALVEDWNGQRQTALTPEAQKARK